MVNVLWNRTGLGRSIYFDDLEVNESFRIRGHQAIYRKVQRGRNDDECLMLEEVTGHIYNPSASPLEKVDVSINIGCERPHLYSKCSV